MEYTQKEEYQVKKKENTGMYDFSGIFYRIWGVSGVLLLLGIVVMLREKPWTGDFAFNLFIVTTSSSREKTDC